PAAATATTSPRLIAWRREAHRIQILLQSNSKPHPQRQGPSERPARPPGGEPTASGGRARQDAARADPSCADARASASYVLPVQALCLLHIIHAFQCNALRFTGQCASMSDTDLCFLPATELADAIRAKKVSAVEITSAVLDRIARLEPKLNAFAYLAAEEA